MRILGIETSCDETAAAVVEAGRVVHSNVISSQIELHRTHGGVVPELAARGQVTAILPVVRAALAEAGIEREQLDAVAVTQGPGLAGSLMVGVNAAKAFAFGLGRPFVVVNHLEAHVYANWLVLPGVLEEEPPPLPAICLLVSGGHTELLLISSERRFTVLGRTLDDAAGEAFDKGARLLGLGYPGGPAIQQTAQGGDSTAIPLPRAWLGERDDFSFSGLKTALLRAVAPWRLPDEVIAPSASPFPEHRPARFRDDLPLADLAASFEEAVVDVLATKTARAARQHVVRSVLIAGGVAANHRLRERLVTEVAVAFAPETPPGVRWPHLSLCTDNAAMVAGLAFERLRQGESAGWDADVFPRFPISTAPFDEDSVTTSH